MPLLTRLTDNPGPKPGASAPTQISRYENGKITPSIDAVVSLTDIFDVSTDYLLLDDAPDEPSTKETTNSVPSAVRISG